MKYWESILKIKIGSGPRGFDTYEFLIEIFDFPLAIFNDLNISRTLSDLIHQGSLDKITRKEFESVVALVDNENYQKAIDRLEILLKRKSKKKFR